jgi:hypothetical protein
MLQTEIDGDAASLKQGQHYTNFDKKARSAKSLSVTRERKVIKVETD